MGSVRAVAGAARERHVDRGGRHGRRGSSRMPSGTSPRARPNQVDSRSAAPTTQSAPARISAAVKCAVPLLSSSVTTPPPMSNRLSVSGVRNARGRALRTRGVGAIGHGVDCVHALGGIGGGGDTTGVAQSRCRGRGVVSVGVGAGRRRRRARRLGPPRARRSRWPGPASTAARRAARVVRRGRRRGAAATAPRGRRRSGRPPR